MRTTLVILPASLLLLAAAMAAGPESAPPPPSPTVEHPVLEAELEALLAEIILTETPRADEQLRQLVLQLRANLSKKTTLQGDR